MQDRTTKEKTAHGCTGFQRTLSSFCLGETDADCTYQRGLDAAKQRDRCVHPAGQAFGGGSKSNVQIAYERLSQTYPARSHCPTDWASQTRSAVVLLAARTNRLDTQSIQTISNLIDISLALSCACGCLAVLHRQIRPGLVLLCTNSFWGFCFYFFVRRTRATSQDQSSQAKKEINSHRDVFK